MEHTLVQPAPAEVGTETSFAVTRVLDRLASQAVATATMLSETDPMSTAPETPDFNQDITAFNSN